MGNSRIHGFLLLCAISASYLPLSSSTAVDFTGDRQFLLLPPESACRGPIAECVLGGDAFQFATVGHRILATATRYISYGALRRNTVPCSRRGASYYNCRPGAPANPYSRGCSAITRCRR
ncbi:protein RALF-like 33 [Momordica charantia]|uniref:Protein RALF-like 33 n=1 Tax=Momordica charantia TaxID=3673 RepID=A0A6J1C8R0_MOMCH|nr:protein RALF-like 33 [Momordica charantia]